MYPEFKETELYLAGQSYAGKYLPLFAHDILETNKIVKDSALKIPLAATMVLDPYPSPVIQRTHMHELPRALGILDDNNMD